MLFADVTGGFFIGLWTVIYVVLLITLGIISLRKGHWVMFIIGLFIPLFWFIGALLPAAGSEPVPAGPARLLLSRSQLLAPHQLQA